MNLENRKIVKRIYWCFEMELKSPLCIGNGIDNITDNDILVDSDGKPFIPGTSFAGAVRDYMEYDDSDADCIMGSKTGKNIGDCDLGLMSAVYFSDIVFTKNNIDVRDGVSLNTDKNVDNKYDYQVLVTGEKANAFINYIIREKDDEAKYNKLIETIYKNINNGEIRFGAKKNRGLGKIYINKVKRKEFSRENVDEYIEKKSKMNESASYESYSLSEEQSNSEQFEKMSISLELVGGISIRKYSAEKGAPDFGTIKCNNQAVIPGTSWNGAFRAATRKILTELNVNNNYVEDCIANWFGSKNGGPVVVSSKIVFEESSIEGGIDKDMTRNAINRFDASTKDGALYTERVHFGGKTKLNILIKKDAKALMGIIGLVIEYMKNGLLPIGGETAIGRGIFSVEEPFENTFANEDNIQDLLKELERNYENK